MHSEFNAVVTIGLLDTVSLVSLEEKPVTKTGALSKDGNHAAVLEDMQLDGFTDWYHHIQPKKEDRTVGTYIVRGKARFDDDWADYTDIAIEPA